MKGKDSKEEASLLSPIPSVDAEGYEEPWGFLAPLQETWLGPCIPVVTWDVMDQARKGRILPLMRVIGKPPEWRLRTLDPLYQECAVRKGCITHHIKNCNTAKHPKGRLSMCFTPALPIELQRLGEIVIDAWRRDCYVVIVDSNPSQ